MAFIDQMRARGFAVGSICQVLGNQGVQVAARTVCDAVVSNALLDEGSYLASIATMYRVLRAAGEVAERRRQATHLNHHGFDAASL